MFAEVDGTLQLVAYLGRRVDIELGPLGALVDGCQGVPKAWICSGKAPITWMAVLVGSRARAPIQLVPS